MRIPFPERVPIDRVAIFAVLLFVIQKLEGTTLFFSAGCALFLLIAALAFNTAGGLTQASGAYIFFYAVLVVIVGICYKAWLGEPAQSNLLDPNTDIEVYVGGITAMLAAAILNRRLRRRAGLLQGILKESEMYRSSVGCILLGATAVFLIGLLGASGEQLQSTFGQLNELIPLGIVIGVMYEIRRSGGTRSVNLPVLLGIGYIFALGILDFSKQGILEPIFCWFVPVCALRYRLTKAQVVSGLLGMFIIFHYLVPYAQYGRRYREPDQTLAQQVAIAIPLLEHPEETRRLYNQEEESTPAGALGEYFNSPQGFWERLQFVSIDDSLVHFTEQGTTVGLAPLGEGLINAVPHFIWPNKPHPKLGGNYYSREILAAQGVYSEDTTTGISFSPTAEAFHMEKWVGILVVAPILWLMLFVVYDSLLGDVRSTPWGLLAVVLIGHEAPEGGLSGIIYLLTFGTEILIFCALFATFAAPVIATTVIGPERRRNQRLTSPHPAAQQTP